MANTYKPFGLLPVGADMLAMKEYLSITGLVGYRNMPLKIDTSTGYVTQWGVADSEAIECILMEDIPTARTAGSVVLCIQCRESMEFIAQCSGTPVQTYVGLIKDLEIASTYYYAVNENSTSNPVFRITGLVPADVGNEVGAYQRVFGHLTRCGIASETTGVYTGNNTFSGLNTFSQTQTVSTSSVGSSGAGESLNIVGAGILAAGASQLRVIMANGSSTSDAIKVVVTAGTAGSYGLHIAAGGNSEGLYVETGTSLLMETLTITSSTIGVSAHGESLDIVGSGVLAAGARQAMITMANGSATSAALEIVATAGTSGAYALIINAGGSAEALHVDSGTVLMDETLTVIGAVTHSSTTLLTGAATFTAAPVFSTGTSITVASTNISTLAAGTYTLDSTSNTVTIVTDAGSASVAGKTIRFILITNPATHNFVFDATTAWFSAQTVSSSTLTGAVYTLVADGTKWGMSASAACHT